VIPADEIELVVAAVGEPARHYRIGQPGAPAALDPHPREDLGHSERDAADRQRKKYRGQMKHGGGIALFDGVENRAIPDVDAILKPTLVTIRITSPMENIHASRSRLCPKIPWR